MYFILFRSARFESQIGNLARQMFSGKKAKELQLAFEDATSNPFSNLIIDFKPGTPDILRFRSNILPDEGELLGMVKLAYAI